MIEKIKLVSKSEIEKIKLLDLKSETTDIDFKEIFSISESKGKVEFVKDIAAFANSKGGYLIYGVNNNYEWIGLDERSDKDVDDANISNLIDNYCDGIEFISNTIEIEGNYFYVIFIFPYEGIISFKKDGQYQKTNWKSNKSTSVSIFHKGDVYCRRGSRSIKADNLFFKQKSNNFKIIENVSKQPIMYSEFIGRKEYLTELYKKLNNINNRIIQIDGIGGIGKTSFVHYFVSQLIKNDEFKNDYDFLIWTSSKRNKYTPKGIKKINEFVANFAELIKEIENFIIENQLFDQTETDCDPVETVNKFLTNNKVLLIVDNLETLNDIDLINFLETFPSKSKAILTTRETLGDFYLSRINLNGFDEKSEFPEFLCSQFKNFSGQNNFLELFNNHISTLYLYTKGMPLAGQLITHQLSQGTPIENIINNLQNGKAYEDILTFCFKGSIEKLDKIEKTLLFIFSLSEKEELLSIDDLIYISELNCDEIGLTGLPKLTTISLCYNKMMDNGVIGYSIPYLAKIYSKQFLDLDNQSFIIEKYENFIQEKLKFNSNDSALTNLFYRSQANNHNEKVLADSALKALSIASYDYDLALSIIEELIKQNSKFPFLYLIKGKIEENGIYHDCLEKARKEFQTAIQLNENYLEALIELGYLEFKSRVGNKDKAKEFIQSSINYFERAERIDPNDQRVCLGLAQGYSKKATQINYYYHKEIKKQVAEKANIYFEKSFYLGDSLNYTQKHSNAITCYAYATNCQNNIRDEKIALSICEKGLTYEPMNSKLLELKRQLEYKVKPDDYITTAFKEKGWIK